MKAVLLTGPGQLEIADLPAVHIQKPTDVLLKVETVGLCGSDIHYYRTGRIGDQRVLYPFVLGHECGAVVEDVGPACTQVAPGDSVVIDPAVSCGTCDMCLADNRHLCRRLRFLGCPGQMEGCLSEYFVLPQDNCFPVSSKMGPEMRALMEPLSIGFYAANFLDDNTSLKIGILGSGPIGLSVALAAREKGVAQIFMTDKFESRRHAAEEAGADWTAGPEETWSLVQKGAFSLDAVFECCGDQDALDQAVALLKPGGTLFIIGIPEHDRISFDPHKLRRKEIAVQNIRRQNKSIPGAIALVTENKVNLELMVTHRFTPDEAQKAFELVSNYEDGVIKACISFVS